MTHFLRIGVLIAAMMLNSGASFAQTPPSATEAFNLRIKCNEMAEDKLKDVETSPNIIAMNRVRIISLLQSSKYDAKNNRCYIRIYEHKFIGVISLDREMHSVYDAQVNDLLAFAQMDNGKKSGMVFDHDNHRTTTNENLGWDDAIKYMDELMADKRN